MFIYLYLYLLLILFKQYKINKQKVHYVMNEHYLYNSMYILDRSLDFVSGLFSQFIFLYNQTYKIYKNFLSEIL